MHTVDHVECVQHIIRLQIHGKIMKKQRLRQGYTKAFFRPKCFWLTVGWPVNHLFFVTVSPCAYSNSVYTIRPCDRSSDCILSVLQCSSVLYSARSMLAFFEVGD